jgi:1-acyl-sn-glycerol-3-phosphate acyltransferase
MSTQLQKIEDVGYDAFGRDPEFISRVQPTLDRLIDRVFRLGIEGAEHLPSGRFILVANHEGAIPWDAMVLTTVLERAEHGGRRVRPLIEDAVMTVPFLGTIMNRLGCVRASRENARRLLARDEPIVVFPEGAQGSGKSFRARHKLRRFGRGGFVKLALETETPLVPVAILGSGDTAPLLAKLPVRFGRTHVPYIPVTPALLPARWGMRILKPIKVHGKIEPGDSVGIAETVDRIRSQIQAALDELVEARPRTY